MICLVSYICINISYIWKEGKMKNKSLILLVFCLMLFTNTTFSFSITALGIISIGGSYDNKYDSISTAQATWTGLNW